MGTIVSTPKLNAFRTALSTRFAKAYASPRDTFYSKVCTEIPSSKKNILLAMFDMLPDLREWTDERLFHNPALHSQLVEHPHYELSMKVNADDVDDDELGSSFLEADGLAERAAEHPDRLLGEVMLNAHNLIGFDGQNFWDTDHPIDAKAGTGSQSNYFASGRPLSTENWEWMRAHMGTWKAGPSGILIKSRPTHLVVPPQLEGLGRRILEAEYNAVAGAGMENNVNKGTAKLLVFDELALEPTAWIALDLRGVLKPFIFAKRKATQFVMKNRPNDEGMFEHNEIRFGVDGRWGVGIGPWFRAAKAKA